MPTGVWDRGPTCFQGHPFDEENTYWYTEKSGKVRRFCRACGRRRQQNRPTKVEVGAKRQRAAQSAAKVKRARLVSGGARRSGMVGKKQQVTLAANSDHNPMAQPNLEEIDELDHDILAYLCEYRSCLSSVVLAAEVQGRSEFEWLIIENILEDLNKRGLVIYRLEREYGIFTRIRPTIKAYEVTGIPYKHPPVVGARWHGHETPVRPGDTTDFRWHGDTAVAVGPIERMPLQDHILTYDHDHWAQWEELLDSGVVK